MSRHNRYRMLPGGFHTRQAKRWAEQGSCSTLIGRMIPRIVKHDNGCWEWTGALTTRGYGEIRCPDRRSPRAVHRLMYEMVIGRVPEGLVLDHLCRNRRCANPDHLEPVTNLVNIRRGTHSNAIKTHCAKGHHYDRENTRLYQRKSGLWRRECCACKSAYNDARRERRKAA